MGMSLRIGDFVAGEFLEFLVARLKDNQFGARCECQQHRAGIHNGTVATASPASAPASATATLSAATTTPSASACTRASSSRRAGRSAPGSLTVLRINAEELVAGCEPEEQPAFKHRGIELDRFLTVAPQFLPGKVIAVFFYLYR